MGIKVGELHNNPLSHDRPAIKRTNIPAIFSEKYIEKAFLKWIPRLLLFKKKREFY